MRWVPLVLLMCAISGCTTGPEPAPKPPSTAPVTVDVPAEATIVARCKKLDRRLLKQQTPAQGSLVHFLSVSKERSEQIGQLNRQLAAIAAALANGCLE